jgi:hypothetical protein
MADNVQGLKNAMGFGISLLAAEHFISAGMSSPWSVAKFAESEQDAAQIWKLFSEAGAASLISAGIMLFVGSEYQRALNGTL